MKEIINYGEARRQQILKGFTNIEECIEEAPIEKARHGVYADNAQNRRLQRVGQEYGHAAQEKPEAGQEEGGVPEGNVSLQNHARQASEEALVKVANDPSADAEMRKVATAELERRGVNVRAKNKKGDQSLRNGLADGDAKSASTFESMGFRQMDDEDLAQYAGVEDAAHAFIKQVGGDEDGFDLVVTKTSEGYRVDKYPYADVDNFESVTVKKIEDVEGAASKFGDPDAKGGKADAKSLVDSFYSAMEDEGDFDAKSFKSYVKEKGGKVVKELAAAIGNLPSETMSSDPDDEEIAAEIESMFKEAGMRVPREVKKELDKLQGSAEGVVDKWNAYLEEEDGGEDFADSLQSLVDKKSDAKVVKELAEAFRNLPAETMSSDPDDGEIAEVIENMYAEAGVKVSKDGHKELDALRGGQKESDTKQAEKAERAKKAAAADKTSKAKGAKLDATLKTVESVDKMVKDVFNEDDSKKFLKNFLKDPEAHAKVLSQRIKSGDKKTAADAQYVANRIAGIIMDPVSRSRGEGVGQEIGNHPELKKFIDANDEANNIKWNQFDMDKEESRRLFDEKRKKMDAARKGFVSKFLEIYGGNTEE